MSNEPTTTEGILRKYCSMTLGDADEDVVDRIWDMANVKLIKGRHLRNLLGDKAALMSFAPNEPVPLDDILLMAGARYIEPGRKH